jgi:hypothetical protein
MFRINMIPHKYSGDPRGGLVPLGLLFQVYRVEPGGGDVRVSDGVSV